MAFKKGESGNPNGRIKGAKSDKTIFWNEMKDWFTTDGAEKFKQELQTLKGSAYVNAYSNALEFFKPRLSRTQVEGNLNNTMTFKVEFTGEDKSGL